jgi:hypothetical protein
MSADKLYKLNFEHFSPIESELVSLAQPESKLSQEKKRAIISAVANSIALIDIVSILSGIESIPNDSESIPCSVESIPVDSTTIDSRNLERDSDNVTKNTRNECQGSGGGVSEGVSSVSGCLPVLNSEIPQKIKTQYGSHGYYPPLCAKIFPKISQKNPSPVTKPNDQTQILNKLNKLVSSLDSVTLSEDEWNESYELHINRRKSKNPISTRRVRW